MRIGKLNDKIVVIYGDDPTNRNVKPSVSAVVLDAATGKITATKSLFEYAGKYAEPKVFFIENSNEFYFGLRYTDAVLKTGWTGDYENSVRMSQTAKFELMAYNEKLEQVSKKEVPVSKPSSFMAMEMTAAKELIVVYMEENGGFHLQQIASNHTELKASKRIKIEFGKGSDLKMDFLLSSFDPSVCYLTWRYLNTDKDRATALYKVNFSTGDVKSRTDLYTKDYKNELKDKYNPTYEKPGRLNPSEWSEMEITGLVEQGDKIICLKEAIISRGGMSVTNTSIETGDGILSILDNDLKLLQETPFAKSYRTGGYETMPTSFTIRGNKVFVVTADNAVLGLTAVIFEYDLDKKQFVRRFIPDRGAIKKLHSLIPVATLWFNKSYAIPVQTDRGYYETSDRLLKVSYSGE